MKKEAAMTVHKFRPARLLVSVLLCALLVLHTACKSGLPAPTGLNIDQISLELSWNPVTGADFYTVRIEGEGGTREMDSGTNSYALEGLEAGNYTIRVKATPPGRSPSPSRGRRRAGSPSARSTATPPLKFRAPASRRATSSSPPPTADCPSPASATRRSAIPSP